MRYVDNGMVDEVRFQVDVKLPGSLNEIVDQIISETVKCCGTQLQAAWYLHVTPAMISNRLNHRRKKLGRLASLTEPSTGTKGDASDPLPPGGEE